MRFPFLHRRHDKQNMRFRTRRGNSRLAVNVPVSRKELRMLRRARTMAFLRWAGVAAAVLALLLYARTQWSREFRSNSDFAVGRFEFHSNGGIAAQQAAAAAGLRGDMNVMGLDLASIRSRLMELPRVKGVNVQRRLPDRLSIELEERLPVAWITSVNNGIEQRNRIFVDNAGVAFKCEELLREYMALPVINCAVLPVVTLGHDVECEAVKSSLALLSEWSTRRWAVPCTVNRIDIPNAWTLTAEMDSGAAFTFHPDQLGVQLDRLAYILEKTRGRNLSVATVNLQMQRNVPVTFFEHVSSSAERMHEPGTAMVVEPTVVSAPPAKIRAKAVSAPVRPARPAPAARQQADIQTILRGK